MSKKTIRSPSFAMNNAATVPEGFGPANPATAGDYEKYMKEHVFDRSVLTGADTYIKQKASFSNVLLTVILASVAVFIPHLIASIF